MKNQFICTALATAVLLFNVNQSCAAENRMDNSKQVTQATKNGMSTKHKTVVAKPVNINGATKEQLKQLPGIGDAEADMIIAGRPYGSKANLVTRNIITRDVYENIKKQIVAKQPFKDGAKNAALYSKKK
jgi:DNA uptake protein ComE-like DNA-binding protein